MSTTTAALPHAKSVRDLLEDLLGRDVDVSPSQPLVPGPKEPCAIAVYVDHGVRTSAVVSFDLALAAYTGASIGLIPRGGAQACIEDRELSPMVRDNLAEVLNVFAALFHSASGTPLRLYGYYEPGELPPTDVSAFVRTVGRRLDISVKIGGYGAGRLAVVLV